MIEKNRSYWLPENLYLYKNKINGTNSFYYGKLEIVPEYLEFISIVENRFKLWNLQRIIENKEFSEVNLIENIRNSINWWTHISQKNNVCEYMFNKARAIKKNNSIAIINNFDDFLKIIKDNNIEVIKWDYFNSQYGSSEQLVENNRKVWFRVEYNEFVYRYHTKEKDIIKYKTSNEKFQILVNPSFLSELIKDNSFKIYTFMYMNDTVELWLHDKTKEMGLSWYGPTVYLITNGIYNYYYLVTDQNEHYYSWGIGKETKDKEIPKSFPILIELPLVDISNYKIVDKDKEKLEFNKSIEYIPFPWENKPNDINIIQTKFIENDNLLIDKLSEIFNLTYSTKSFRPWLQYKDISIIDFKLTEDGIIYAVDNNNYYFNLEESINTLSKFINHSSFAFDWFESKLRNFKACYFTGTELSFKVNPIKWIDKQKKVIEIIFRNMLKQEMPNYPEKLLEIYIQTQFKIVDKNIQRNKHIWIEQQTKGIPF